MTTTVVTKSDANAYQSLSYNASIKGAPSPNKDSYSPVNGYDINISSKSQKISGIPTLLRSGSQLLKRAVSLPAGSLRASTFTIITGMVGGGTLTFSYGIKMCGLIPSIIYMLMSPILAGLSTYGLVYSAEKNNCSSYRKLSIKLYGKKFSYLMQGNLLLMLWSVSISYMTLTKSLGNSALSKLVNSQYKNEWYISERFVLTILTFSVVLPLGM